MWPKKRETETASSQYTLSRDQSARIAAELCHTVELIEICGPAHAIHQRAADMRGGPGNACHAFAHFAMGQVLRNQGRFVEAVREYETTIALDRNLVMAYAHLGTANSTQGRLRR